MLQIRVVCKLDIPTSDIDEQRGPGNMFTGDDLWLFHSETHEVKCPNSLTCVNVERKDDIRRKKLFNLWGLGVGRIEKMSLPLSSGKSGVNSWPGGWLTTANGDQDLQ
jgi:hypothetical protein